MKKSLYVSLLVLLAQVVLAGTSGIYRDKKYENIDGREELVELDRLGMAGLSLWDSTLQDAQWVVGISSVQVRRHEYGGADSQVCYVGNGFTLLLNSPLEGDRQIIQGAIVSAERKISERFSPCTVIAKDVRNFEFIGGVKLGMSAAEVEKIWGEPSKRAKGVLIFSIRRITKEYFTDDLSFYFEFKNNRLTYADISRTAIH